MGLPRVWGVESEGWAGARREGERVWLEEKLSRDLGGALAQARRLDLLRWLAESVLIWGSCASG